MRSNGFGRSTLALLLGASLLWLCGCGGGLAQARLTEGDGSKASELNAPLAVGASMEPKVQLALQGTASPSIRLVSTRPSVLGVENAEVLGRAPGVAALLITTEGGEVLDFYHVWVEAPTRVALQLVDAEGENLGEAREGIDLLVGEQVYLQPRSYFEAQQLAGTLDGEWTLDSHAVEVLRQGIHERRRLVAIAPGSARLTFTSSGVSQSLTIRVLARPHQPGAPS